jgi:phage recombination protein Bet
MTDTALVTSAIDPEIAAAIRIADRLTPLKHALGIEDLSDAEMQLFAMVAHHTGLDPFTKQIYAIKRGGKVMHQTGIDGYRSSAERTREYAGSEEATYEECQCGDAGSPPQHPSVARVVVHRLMANGHMVNQTGVARWHELKPDHTASKSGRGFADDMWWQMPYNQLAKCAEANGLRKAFPRVLGGVYIAEEMEQADTVDGTAVEVLRQSPRERIAARRAAIEAPEATAEPIPSPAAAPEPSTGVCGATAGDLGGADVCILPSGHHGPHKSEEAVWPA